MDYLFAFLPNHHCTLFVPLNVADDEYWFAAEIDLLPNGDIANNFIRKYSVWDKRPLKKFSVGALVGIIRHILLAKKTERCISPFINLKIITKVGEVRAKIVSFLAVSCCIRCICHRRRIPFHLKSFSFYKIQVFGIQRHFVLHEWAATQYGALLIARWLACLICRWCEHRAQRFCIAQDKVVNKCRIFIWWGIGSHVAYFWMHNPSQYTGVHGQYLLQLPSLHAIPAIKSCSINCVRTSVTLVKWEDFPYSKDRQHLCEMTHVFRIMRISDSSLTPTTMSVLENHDYIVLHFLTCTIHMKKLKEQKEIHERIVIKTTVEKRRCTNCLKALMISQTT